MAEDIPQNLDLERVLATLASLQNQNQSTAQPAQQLSDQTHEYPTAQAPVAQQPHSLPYHATADPRLARQQHVHQAAPPRPQEQTSTPMIDPSTITEWKQGLRCVTKISGQNPEFSGAIRKLMKEQENNIKQWEAGRERLIADQKLKKTNEATHREVLSLPGLLENTPVLRTPEREAEELAAYDAKVYRASKAMVDSQSSALKVLGVPFFGVKPYLVLHETETAGAGDAGGRGKKISSEELLDLQRRMVGYLMELYGD